jgi:dethiobiotin synthetase
MTDCPGYFITGTDTGVGKTAITLGLMQRLQQQGYRVAAMKPVASGCRRTAQGLRNADALLLQQQASMPLDYGSLNPYAFEPAIAPHIAAREAHTRIELGTLRAALAAVTRNADRVCVEGAGGWLVPLNEQHSAAEIAGLAKLEVVLVVAVRLGCLNHALLTARAIEADGFRLAGWVANLLPPAAERRAENVAALTERLAAPLLGVVPCLSAVTAQAVAGYLTAL